MKPFVQSYQKKDLKDNSFHCFRVKLETLKKFVELSNGNFVPYYNAFKSGCFLIYYYFLDWLRLNCMEVFHYVAEKLRVYPLFENANNRIKINKERGAVYNDFDFDSGELLSECTNNTTYSQTLVQDARDAFPLNSNTLVPQISIDHVVLEADKNNKPVFYNTLAFDHPVYDISSSTPNKEYLNKVHRLATGGYKDINCSKELIDIYEM